MDREFSDFISKVLDRTDIVSLISSYTKLEKKGNTHWACCPFHNESQPSFAVNEAKQFFHCFGCKESGNALSFLMKVENIEFIDALKILAEKAGLELPKTGNYARSGVDKKQREKLYELMRDAARHYYDNLSDPRAAVFREYLEKRQISKNMIVKFGLGASLDYNEMVAYLKSKGYTYEQMHAVGIAESKDGREYDVFGRRLIYPIIDNLGHVVAFGGRTLEKNPQFGKYRNSSQTELFDKSRVLYAVNLLKKRKAKGPIDYCIMTEGYMDVITLHKAGFDTAVASMGTALTVRQAKQLKLYSDVVYICYDGDSAGQKATLRGLDILKECGLTVKVVRLPDGLDPDDLIKRDGAAGYQKCLDDAIPLTAYKIEVLKSKYDVADPDQRAKFAIEAMSFVNSLDNPVEQEQYFDYVSNITGFSVDALKRQSNISGAVSKREQPPTEQPRQTVETKTADYDKTIKFFMSSIVQSKDYIDFDKDISAALPDDITRELYAFCRDNRYANMSAILFEEFGDRCAKLLNDLFDFEFLPGDGRTKFVDIENMLYGKILEAELKRLTEKYKVTPKDTPQGKELGAKINAVSVELNNLKKRS